MNDSPVIQFYPCIEFLKYIVFPYVLFYFVGWFSSFFHLLQYCSYFISFNKLNGFFCYFKIIYTSDRAYFYKLYLVIQREIDYYKLLVLLLYFLNVFGKNIVKADMNS